MDEDLERRIQRAIELLNTCKHASMATVNEDGSPHNTPFLFLHDSKLENIYWGSHPESLHSQNILRTSKIFVVLYDAIKRGGLYIRAEKGHILDEEELKIALAVHNEVRSKENLEPLEFSYYTGNSPQRMWGAKINNFWVNDTERDVDGHVIKDGRREISAQDLLNNSF